MEAAQARVRRHRHAGGRKGARLRTPHVGTDRSARRYAQQGGCRFERPVIADRVGHGDELAPSRLRSIAPSAAEQRHRQLVVRAVVVRMRNRDRGDALPARGDAPPRFTGSASGKIVDSAASATRYHSMANVIAGWRRRARQASRRAARAARLADVAVRTRGDESPRPASAVTSQESRLASSPACRQRRPGRRATPRRSGPDPIDPVGQGLLLAEYQIGSRLAATRRGRKGKP